MHIVSWVWELNHLILVLKPKGRRGTPHEVVFEPNTSDTPILSSLMAGVVENFLKELSRGSRQNHHPSISNALPDSFLLQAQGGGGTTT